MGEDPRLGILADAILDGTPVDWPDAESSTVLESRQVVRELQVLAEIAALHRGHPSGTPPLGAEVHTAALPAWGHLELRGLLGRGTYGDVYRAWDRHLDREVALKLLRARVSAADPLASVADPRRVVAEGRLLARVRHPHVITVYGAEPRGDGVGIWMEHIRGRTLHQIVEQQGPLGAREAAGIGLDLCRALAAVHGAGLLHRDVTARNVMREDGGRIVLMDFGAGHDQADVASGTTWVAGTPLYMAPELFDGAAPDQRADIYGLGVLLYFLVSARFPVAGRTFDQIREAHAGGRRIRLREVRPDLPSAFVQAVERATAPAPASRVQSIGELESALQECLLVERPVPATRRITPARLAAGLAAVAVLAGVGWRLAPLLGGRQGAGSSGAGTASAATSVTMRKLAAMPTFSRPSNPSGDGRFVAASAASGDAVLIDLAVGDARPLGVTHLEAGDDDGYASITVLSADARRVAVNWWQDGRGSLRVVNTDGTGARTLLAPAGDAMPYQWSRDGSMLLTAVVEADGVGTIALVATEDGAVRPIRRLQGWVNDLPKSMSLSPDGRYIAYDYPEGPAAAERDIFILDAHTGTEARLDAPPGHDTSPLWAPDGRTLVFFSDRSRSVAIWAVSVEHGRPQGAPRLLKDDLGRVRARGFADDGTLHVDLTVGHPEIYISRLDAAGDAMPPLSPRQALGNFFPMWSPDGLRLAYTSERHDQDGRELWVFDTVSGQESRIETPEKVGRPIGWSPDGAKLLVSGANNPRLSIVDRASGQTSLVPECAPRAAWLPEGIACLGAGRVTLRDPRTGRVLRVLDLGDSQITSFGLAVDGRSVIAAHRNGSLVLQDVRAGGRREWSDPGVASLDRHATAPHTADVAYLVNRRDANGESRAIMLWRGAGDPRALMTVRAPEAVVFEGWTADGSAVLATRWTAVPEGSAPAAVMRTLWRLPVNGTAPSPTRLTIEGLRDVSVHPDGQRVAFNAGWKKYESWALEHLLAR